MNSSIKNDKGDTVLVNTLITTGKKYYKENNINEARKNIQQALDISSGIAYRNGMLLSYNELGLYQYAEGNYSKSLELYLKALKIAEASGNKKSIANVYRQIGNVYVAQDNLQKGFDYTFKSLQLYKELQDKKNMAELHLYLAHLYEYQNKYTEIEQNFSIAIQLSASIKDTIFLGILYEQFGNYYIEKKDYEKAISYHGLSLEASRSLKDEKGVADSYSDIGNIYLAQNKFEQALQNNLQALDMYKKCNAWPETIAESNMIIGQIYMSLGKIEEAVNYHLSALKIAEHLPDKYTWSTTVYFSLSKVYVQAKNYDQATVYLNKVINAAKKINNENNLKKAYQKLSELAVLKQDYRSAYSFQKLYAGLSDSVYNMSQKQLHEVQKLQEQFEEEKKENEKKLHEAQITQKEVELKQAATLRYTLIAGLLLILVFSGFIYNRFKLTQKQNQTILIQKELVEQKRNEVELQKHVIEHKQKEIIESISYAKRLQEAILPSQDFVNKYLPSNFILYQPKDLVAGDFYWAEQINGSFYIAAADSTGHGVPGAMVSVVCSGALNRAVKEFKETETGRILDKARELVLETFEKSESEVKDGMDISLLCIDKIKQKIYWSGANNPLWYTQNGEMKEIKADKQPIGKSDHARPFTTHVIEYASDTIFYLFTDGFADQFGGERQKKFKYKPLRDLLQINSIKDLPTQKEALLYAFSQWKGDLDQVDDVCIIGVKV